MIWLMIQVWTWLAVFYILGLATGWILKRRPTMEEAYEGTRIYEVDDFDSSKNPDTSRKTDTAPALDLDDRKSDDAPVIRQRIYETKTPPEKTAEQSAASLSDLPDLEKREPSRRTPVEPAASVNATPSTDDNRPVRKSTPKLYSAPMQGPADDLKDIKGVGPTLERTLNATGIYYFEQIAAWTDEEIAWIDNRIDFPGRVKREKWVPQAEVLAAGQRKEQDAKKSKDESISKDDSGPKLVSSSSPSSSSSQVTGQSARILDTKPTIITKTPASDSTHEGARLSGTQASSTSSTKAPESMLDRLMAKKNS